MRVLARSGFLAAALSMAACAAPGPPASFPAPLSASPSPAATAASPGATPRESPSPAGPAPSSRSPVPRASGPASPSAGSAASPFQAYDVLRVVADGVVVREGPSVENPALESIRDGQPIGDARLQAGDYVSVEMGPLRAGDEPWYLVWPARADQLRHGPASWRKAGADGGSYPGWILASANGEDLFSVHLRPDPAEGLPEGPTLMSAGAGDYASPPQPRHDLFSINWAAAPNDGTCQFTLRLVPRNGPELVVAVDVTVEAPTSGPLSGPGSLVETPWNPPSEGFGPWEVYTVEVASDCAWTFSLWPAGHD
jgi:hypothetical protein